MTHEENEINVGDWVEDFVGRDCKVVDLRNTHDSNGNPMTMAKVDFSDSDKGDKFIRPDTDYEIDVELCKKL